MANLLGYHNKDFFENHQWSEEWEVLVGRVLCMKLLGRNNLIIVLILPMTLEVLQIPLTNS